MALQKNIYAIFEERVNFAKLTAHNGAVSYYTSIDGAAPGSLTHYYLVDSVDSADPTAPATELNDFLVTQGLLGYSFVDCAVYEHAGKSRLVVSLADLAGTGVTANRVRVRIWEERFVLTDPGPLQFALGAANPTNISRPTNTDLFNFSKATLISSSDDWPNLQAYFKSLVTAPVQAPGVADAVPAGNAIALLRLLAHRAADRGIYVTADVGPATHVMP